MMGPVSIASTIIAFPVIPGSEVIMHTILITACLRFPGVFMSPAEVQNRSQPLRCQRQRFGVDCVCEVVAAAIMLPAVQFILVIF